MDQNSQGNTSRPSVLDQMSETQLLELQRQFSEGDEGEWGRITGSYGWSQQQSQEVWSWFGQDPTAQQSSHDQTS